METMPLILIVGLPGTGKTSLAKTLLDQYFTDYIYLSTDEVRKKFFNLTNHHYESFNQKIYSQDKRDVIYHVINLMVETLLSQNFSVIVEGTYYSQDKRETIINTCKQLKHKYLIIQTTFPEEQIKKRIEKRVTLNTDPSDARYQIYVALKEQFEPIQFPHITIQTQKSLATNIKEVKKSFDAISS
jgi:predicted kinase